MENIEGLIYVVKVGKVPGIYFSKEEMIQQVKGFSGADVGKFKDIEKAKKFFLGAARIKKHEKRHLTDEEKAKKLAMRIRSSKSLRLKLNGDIICFIDCEADKNIAISIGAVIIDNKSDKILDTFYSTIKPADFTQLSNYIKNLTGLTDSQISESPTFDIVYSNFLKFLKHYNVSDIFSWGNNDINFLKKCNSGNLVTFKSIIKIKDIQKFISVATAEICYNKQWSLQNMKRFCGVSEVVNHNALADAQDLTRIYFSWKNKLIDFKEIINYVNEENRCQNERAS